MSDTTLATAVERFATAANRLSAAGLEQPWQWGEYDEGLRFACLRTMEELRELAVHLASARATSQTPITAAQRILGQYHAAYRELAALLLGVSDMLADQAPAAGQWPLRLVLRHIIEADAGFFVLVSYALQRHRSGDDRPAKIPDAFWVSTLGPEQAYDELMQSPLSNLLAFYADFHARILGELYDIADSELAWPSAYWESYEMPLRFRLHRFESHLRQHSIQAEKTLAAIGHAPSEANQLVRLIYAALAEAEAATLGAANLGGEWRNATATAINARAAEIESIGDPL